MLIIIILPNGVSVKNKFAEKSGMHYAKKIVAVIIAFCFIQFISAQNNYVTHTLKQGETLSLLAKQYNTTVSDIMVLNGMHADSKLVYGSKIKIPSAKAQTTVAKKETVNTNTAAITPPVTTSSNEITHIVAKGETLYSISKKYNTTVGQLKAWNHLTEDNATLGTLLIISDKGNNKFATTNDQKQKTDISTQPVTQPVADVVQPDQTVENANSSVITKPETAAQTQADVNTQPVADYTGNGFFASQFKARKSKNVQNISGISKTFKTASGWTDGKYYILANDIEPGTIVKVTAENGSAVYAKVLWNMGDLKENTGINFRVSNATAAALHINDQSFNLNVSF